MQTTELEKLFEKKESLKERFKPHLENLLQAFDENFKTMIAVGNGYKEKIVEIETVKKVEQRQIQKENGEVETIDVDVFENVEVEKDNPISKEDFIACMYFDILFEKSFSGIENYNKNILLPKMVSKAIDGVTFR